MVSTVIVVALPWSSEPAQVKHRVFVAKRRRAKYLLHGV